MFATIRRYTLPSERKEMLVSLIREEYLQPLTEIPGFDGYFVMNSGEDEVITMTLCETREGCEASTRLAREVAGRHPEVGLSAPEVGMGDILLHRESSLLAGVR